MFRRGVFVGVAALLLGIPASGATFTYTQSDSSTGSGTIQPFNYDPGDGQGPIAFGSTAMPAAAVFNPNTALTPAGYVGAITAQALAGNESNAAVGLLFNGTVQATGTRNGTTYTINIPLVFAPKVTQTPTDTNDYNWNIAYGDNPTAAGVDTTSTSMRFATWLNRDTVIDAADTSNTYQRYTQDNKTFVAGQDSFTNTDTTTAPIKDASDSGAPAGTDAEGRALEFYFGWRDQGALTTGAVLVDNFTVGGLLNPDPNSLTPPTPEPTALGMLAAVALAGCARRRRRA
jgi:hypothetical protein